MRALELVFAIGLSAVLAEAPARADDASRALLFRVTGPPPLTYDNTALGRASHRVRIDVTNTGDAVLALTPFTLAVTLARDGVGYACEDNDGTRRSTQIDPGKTVTIERVVSCETPLPGVYTATVAMTGRSIGSFILQVDPGLGPPVAVPWDSRLKVAAAATKEARPSKDGSAARIAVAFVNAGKSSVTLEKARAIVHVTRREGSMPPCGEKVLALDFAGQLEAGRSQARSAPLACDFSTAGIYDVEIAVATSKGTVVVAKTAIRSAVLPPPRPEATGALESM